MAAITGGTGKSCLERLLFNGLFRLDLVVSGMLIRFFFISFFVATACLVNGQTVIVNPDGTHTVVIGADQAGSPGIIVHPNGTHSVVHSSGAHSVVVAPNGGHTVILNQQLLLSMLPILFFIQ